MTQFVPTQNFLKIFCAFILLHVSMSRESFGGLYDYRKYFCHLIGEIGSLTLPLECYLPSTETNDNREQQTLYCVETLNLGGDWSQKLAYLTESSKLLSLFEPQAPHLYYISQGSYRESVPCLQSHMLHVNSHFLPIHVLTQT